MERDRRRRHRSRQERKTIPGGSHPTLIQSVGGHVPHRDRQFGINTSYLQ